MSYLVKAELIASDSDIINSIIREFSFEKRKDHHCTLIFAKEWNKTSELCKDDLQSNIQSPVFVKGADQFGEAIVLLVDRDRDSFLCRRNLELVDKLVAVEEHPVYNPHVTIGYSKETLDENTKSKIAEMFKLCSFTLSHEVAKIFV